MRKKIAKELPELASDLADAILGLVEDHVPLLKLANPVLRQIVKGLTEAGLNLPEKENDSIETELRACIQAVLEDMAENAPTVREQNDAQMLTQETDLTPSAALPTILDCARSVEQAIVRLSKTGDMEMMNHEQADFLERFQNIFRQKLPEYQTLSNHVLLTKAEDTHKVVVQTNKNVGQMGDQLNRVEQKIDLLLNEQTVCAKELLLRLEKAFQQEKRNSPRFVADEVSENLLPLLNEANVSIEKNQVMRFSDYLHHYQTLPEQNHISLTGIGGIGKTTALLYSEYTCPVVYIPLRDLATEENPLEHYILNTTVGTEEMYKAFQSLCRCPWDGGPMITLLLDGFNELNKPRRARVLKELSTNWLKMDGVQVIITSRYDIQTEDIDTGTFRHFRHAHIQPLERETIQAYLAEVLNPNNDPNQKNIPKPENIPKMVDRIWGLLRTPLFLTLYSHATRFRSENAYSLEFWREDLNNGSIIWNYLLTEWIKLPDAEKPTGFFAIFLVAPRICWKMETLGMFSIPRPWLRQEIMSTTEGLLECIDDCRLPEYVLSRCDQMAGTPEQWFDTRALMQILIERIRLFIRDAASVKIAHQHFRDCLAAIHIMNTAFMSETLPEEWKAEFSPHVMEFVADLMESEGRDPDRTWERVWQIKDAYQEPAFLEKMLALYRNAYGPDLSRVDFSGLDLRQVSLAGLRFSGSSREHFRGTRLDWDTFFGKGHGDTVSAVSWCPDGNHYLSASYDCTLRLYAADGNVRLPQIHAREHHGYYIRCARFDPSRPDRFASGGDDQTVVVWTLEEDHWSGQEWGRCGNWVRKLDWTTDGGKLICGDGDGRVFLFRGPGQQTCPEGLDGTITALRWSGDNARFAAADEKGLLHLYGADGTLLFRRRLDGKVVSLAWLCADSLLLAATEQQLYLLSGKELSILDQETFKERVSCVCSIDVHTTAAQTAVFTSAGLLLRRIQIIEDHPKIMDQASWEYKGDVTQITSAQWHPNVDKLICGGQDGSVLQIDVDITEADRDRIQVRVIGQRCCRAARCSAWSPDSGTLAVGWDDNRVRLWDVAQNRCTRVLIGHRESIKCLAWSPDGQYLASGSDDSDIRIWKPDGSEQTVIRDHKGPVNTLLWLSETVLVSAGDDAIVLVTDLTTEKSRALAGHAKKIYALACSEDGKQLLSCGNDCTAILWDTGTWEHTPAQRVHDKPVRAAAWRKGLVMTSSNDTTAKLWRVENGSLVHLRTLTGLRDFVYGANLSLDGRYVVGACTDSHVAFWKTEQTEAFCISDVHKNFAWHVSVAPDRAATASSDGTVRVWDLSGDGIREKMEPIQTLEAIPESCLVDCDLRGAEMDEKLRRLLQHNGAKVDEGPEA